MPCAPRFESEDFQARRQSVQQELQEKQQKAFEKLHQMSQERDLTPLRTPAGLVFAPVREGEVLDPASWKSCPRKKRGNWRKKPRNCSRKRRRSFRKIPQWQREIREKQKELNREATQYAVGPVFEELRGRYEGRLAVTEYLESMEKDIVDSAHVLFQSEGGQGQAGDQPSPNFRYRQARDRPANLPRCAGTGSTSSWTTAKPADRRWSMQDNPTLQNLLGRVEHWPIWGRW